MSADELVYDWHRNCIIAIIMFSITIEQYWCDENTSCETQSDIFQNS